ncbi:MAG: acetyl-CoA carboxylase, biotin carboxyl carrier protein [Bacillota bacterium]|jgi:acetyl-CoA carboxylase biotin carboxyl carrier protein|nr:acetyl-CoA carboxylase, biotin carboxyl carrier protein [Bacillota bacterium]NLP21295.1 acetyl-CoA carboxylase, biotin carboxyl carrier protein [Erysipelotrichaceae bacterium]
MDINKIKEIIEMFEETKLQELTLELDDMKIGMKKSTGEVIREVVAPVVQSTSVETKEEEEVLGEWVKAPFIGTFYRAPSENSEPFIKVGKKVNEGDTLCILEAMKVMNEIKSPKSGTILEIKANNGSMVEFGEEMILIGD